MATTRMVLAVIAMVLLMAGFVAVRREQHGYAAWLLTFGFGAATAWGALTIALSNEGKASIPFDGAVALTSMAVMFTLFYFVKAINREAVT